MRLTLRTLLAYLDDQLTPAEAREIGAKLQEAPAARELAERAKEVMRRRRLGVPGDPTAGGDGDAPTPAGPVLDPNEIGAYLDNALPPERVAAVEQVCLNDDTHLAEVAAGHQILTQVLSDPVAVPPALAARLVELAPAAEGDSDDVAPARRSRPAHRSSPTIAAVRAQSPVSKGFEDGLPEHLRKHTRSGWGWVPYAAAALLAALWLGSLVIDNDLDLFNGSANADGSENETGMPPAVVADADVDDPEGADADVPLSDVDLAAADADRAAAARAAADAAEAGRLADVLPVDPVPPEGTDDPAMPATDDPTAVAVASTDAPATPDAENPDAGDPASPAAAPAAPVIVAAGRGLYAFDPNRSGYFAVAVGEGAPTNVPLVVPDPLRATLDVDGVPLRFELLGGTRATLAPTVTAGAEAGLAVTDGHVLVRRTGGGSDEDATFVLQAGGAKWKLTLGSGATVAVAVEPRRPRGAGADLAGAPSRAALAALDGEVQAVDLAPGSTGESVALPAGSVAALVTADGRLAAPGAAGAGAAGLFTDGLPPWASDAPLTEADTIAADQFAEALVPGQPLEISLPSLVEDPREIPARQAAAALALAGRSGDLARTLKRTPHPTVVLVAADGLRRLLGRNPEADAEVNDALDREFSPQARVALARLLDRLTDAEARDPQISGTVVDSLESPELAVRTLAITELERLTGVTKSYRPLDSANQRDSAVKRWRRELERTGALLDPNEAPAEPAADGGEAGDPTGVDFESLIPGDL